MKNFEFKNLHILYSGQGFVQYLMNNIWWNISYFDFHSKHSDLACKYFGYETGMLISNTEEKRMTNLIFGISCPKIVSSFQDCSIISQYNHLFRLKSNKLLLLCSNDKLSCPTIRNIQNVTLEKFMGKCYYLFNLKRSVNFDEMEKFCIKKNLKLVTLSSKEQARFIFNKIQTQKSKNLKYKNYRNFYKIIEKISKETFIPISKENDKIIYCITI